MKKHRSYEDLLPLYAAGKGSAVERAEMEAHLAVCADCRADLDLLQAIAGEIRASSRRAAAPPDLAARALAQARAQTVRGGLPSACRRAWQLLRAQAGLVQREMWPASAAVMLLGVVVAILSNHAEAVYFIAPLAAAASLAALFGPEHDPAYELIMSTPTSHWHLLLARLSIVSAYNLILALGASLALLAILPAHLLGNIILGWLGPLAFLSALGLLLSIWLGTGNAVAITYGLWLAHYISYQSITLLGGSPVWEEILLAYRSFWNSPLLLLALSIILTVLALASSGRPAFRLKAEIG